jgi:hypothetical protein
MALGLLLVWWHLLAPIVNHQHQGVLLWFASVLCSVSLTFWLWCVVRFIEARFSKRNETADQRSTDAAALASARHEELLALVGKHCRSVQALHKRLETMERQLESTNKTLEATNKELAHLRKLILDEEEPIPNQRAGPRSIS